MKYLIEKTVELRRANYDIALFLEIEPSMRRFQALAAALAGIGTRVGLDLRKETRFLTRIVPLDREKYWPEVFGDVIRAVGFSLDSTAMALDSAEEDARKADRLIRDASDGRDAMTVVVIHATANNWGLRKNWGDDNFSELIDRIRSWRGDCLIFLTGVESERSRIEKLCSGNSERVQNLAGRLSVREMLALLSRSDLLITGDTLALHLGVIAKTRTIAIFGPTDPLRILPRDRNQGRIRVVRKALACSPCHGTNRMGDPTKKLNFCTNPAREQCLNELSVDDVFGEVVGILRRGRGILE
jgi:ADP-heptose:LPS heptosyltransferase